MSDARFEDADPSARPLRLKAEGEDDLAAISALVQDAVGQVGEIHWAKTKQRLVIVLHRFRWEDREAADREGRPYERVQSALTVQNVLAVRARGLQPTESETVFAVLALRWAPGAEDAGGTLTVTVAGDGEIAAEVEALEVILADVSRPWAAKARKAPDHGV